MEAVEAVEDVEGVGGCESAIFVCSVISDAENSRCTSTKLPSVTKALFQNQRNLRSHKVRLRRNKQQLFASVTTLLACFHCAVHWTWQLACKPVSVWFGCSADKLDSVVLSVGALLSALFWYDATVSLLDDFQCCTILDSNFLILCCYHTTDLIILLALI